MTPSLAIIVGLALASGPSRPSRYRARQFAAYDARVPLRLVDTDAPTPSAPAFCTAASSLGLLSGSYACLNGDGTQDSSAGMTLSAVGSPTTQTLEWCPNGLECAAVSRQRLTASDSYATASVSAPAGDFSVCWVGEVDAPLGAVTLVSGPGYSLSVSATGVATFTSGASSVSTSAGVVTGSADQLVCGTRTGTTGTVSVDGAVTSGTVAAPSGSAVVSVGGFAGAARGAMVTGHLLTSTEAAQLAAALIPIPHGTRGEAVDFSRPSAFSCTAPDGSVSPLPPNRPCISGGLRVRPATTNLLTYSEAPDNAAWAGGATATAGTVTAPDGTATADTLASTGVHQCRYQIATSTGGPATMSFYGMGASIGYSAELFDMTAAVSLGLTNCTATSTRGRCSVSVASTTSGNSIEFRECADSATPIDVWGAQAEWSATASDYCRSEGTSATCAAEVPTVPKPSSLSTARGCARFCVTPTWTGANPLASILALVSGNTAGTARLGYIPASAQSVAISDGTHTATVATTLTSGTASCYRTTWDSGAGTLTVTDETSGTSASATGFAGFASFDSTLGVGQENSGSQPLGAAISSLTLGTSPGGCR